MIDVKSKTGLKGLKVEKQKSSEDDQIKDEVNEIHGNDDDSDQIDDFYEDDIDHLQEERNRGAPNSDLESDLDYSQTHLEDFLKS